MCICFQKEKEKKEKERVKRGCSSTLMINVLRNREFTSKNIDFYKKKMVLELK